MDELKVYTGKETMQALLEGKTLKHNRTGYMYKIDGSKLKGKIGDKEWSSPFILAELLFSEGFTEVATPQVGDWVKVTTDSGKTYTGKLTSVSNEGMKAKWNDNDYIGYLKFKSRTWETLSPEQVSEYKREQAFVKVGRKLNEFREGDFVLIETETSSIVCVVTSKNNTTEIAVHKLNDAKGYKAKPHQLTPISFVEDQISL